MEFYEVKSGSRNPYPRKPKKTGFWIRVSNLGQCAISAGILEEEKKLVDSIRFEASVEGYQFRFKLGEGYSRPVVGRIFNIPLELARNIMMEYCTWVGRGKSYYFKMERNGEGYWTVKEVMPGKPKDIDF